MINKQEYLNLHKQYENGRLSRCIYNYVYPQSTLIIQSIPVLNL